MRTLTTLAIRTTLIVSVIGLWFIANPERGYACSCAEPGSPSEALADSAAVFLGKAVSVREFDRGDGSRGSADPTTIEFDVKTVWKGDDHQTMYLTTPRWDASCGFTFVEGEDYIVYSWDGSEVSLCSRTRSLSEAAADLDELGEGRSPIQGKVAPTPDVSTGGGCGLSSTTDVSVVGLMADLALFSLRKRFLG